MIARVARDAVFTDAHIESQHTPQPAAYCENTSTFIERMSQHNCLAFGLETVAVRFSSRPESGPLGDHWSTWHHPAPHRSRISGSHLTFDNCVPNEASQRTNFRFQSQFWHSCEVCLPPKLLTWHSTGGILLLCSHCSPPICSVSIIV